MTIEIKRISEITGDILIKEEYNINISGLVENYKKQISTLSNYNYIKFYKYDEKGRILESVVDDNVSEKYKYSYNKNIFVTEIEMIGSNSLPQKEVYCYSGILSSRIVVSSEDTIKSNEVIKDDNGSITEVINDFLKNSKDSIIYSFDNKENLCQVIYLNKKKKMQFEYDIQGRLTKKRIIFNFKELNPNKVEFNYFYDNKDLLNKLTYSTNNVLKYTEYYIYM